MRWIVIAASISGASTVIIGAMAAHMGNAPNMAIGYEHIQTGLRYQQWHSIALLVLGLFCLDSDVAGRRAKVITGAAALFLAGIIMFSGSLYASVMFGMPALTKLTPFGGVSFIFAWLSLALLTLPEARNG